SLRSAPFKGAPMLTWTGEIGRVLSATLEGGAKVAGLDMVIPASIEQSEIPFGEGMLGDKVRGFDRDFLRALAGAATNGKVVLGEILGGNQPVRPSPGQRVAVRQQQNIRPLNVHVDSDDIVRRLPLSFPVNGAKVPSMAAELASRALGAAPEFDERGRLTLAGYRVPGRVPNTMTLNFEGGADDIPTFSFADLRVRRHERQGLLSALVCRKGCHFRQRSRYRGPPPDLQALCNRHRRRARAALRGREHAGHRGLQDQHDRGRLYSCYRGQQPDLAQRGGRTGPAGALPDLRPVCGAGGRRRVAVSAAQRRTGLDSRDRGQHCRRNDRLQPRAGAADRRA